MHNARLTTTNRPPRLFARSTQRSARAIALTLISALTLTACASPTLTALPPTAPGSADAGKPIRPLACDELKIVHFHLGKITPDGQSNIAKDDVSARLGLPDWLAQLHHLFGDTDDTIKASKENNAVLHTLCDTPVK